MASNIKSISPRTQLASYSPSSEINFDIVSDQAIVPGSVFLTGKVRIIAGNFANARKYYDNYAGLVASCLENVTVRCAAYQEVISNYARYVKLNHMLQYSTDSLCAGLKQSGELMAPHIDVTRAILNDSTVAGGMPFAHKLMNSLNNASGNMSVAKLGGKVQLSFKLCPPSKVFFGADMADLDYQLSDLELHYKVSDMAPDSVSINVIEDSQKLIQSSDTTIQNTWVNPINKLACVFAMTAVETNPTQNSLQCQHPPIERVSWFFNDQQNNFYSYEILTTEEMVLTALDLMPTKGNGIDIREFQTALAQNGANSYQDKFALGLNLAGEMNFSQSPVGLNVRLAAGFSEIYAYFYAYGKQMI